MANVLVVASRPPWPLDDGNALRVYELVRNLGPDHTCHLACSDRRTEKLAELEEQGVFHSITVLPRRPDRMHWRRLLRRGDHDFIRTAYPDHFRQLTATLQTVVDRHDIDVVLAILMRCEEYIRPLRNVTKVVDQYDCATLALERDLAVAPPTTPLARWRARRQIARTAAQEARLGTACQLITTIAEPDAARLRRLSPAGSRIEVIPNGVDTGLLELPRPDDDCPPAVAFWGNLEFEVNRQAVHHFYEKIWRPHLEPHGIGWAIVGPNADAAITDLAARHEQIVVPGFVDDLFGFLRGYPLMVNAMVSGAGLKNKVLEAFAAGLPVVSTAMGVEALPVRDGVHCRIADDPETFARIVRDLLADPSARRRLAAGAEALVRSDYDWSTIGARLSRTLS